MRKHCTLVGFCSEDLKLEFWIDKALASLLTVGLALS